MPRRKERYAALDLGTNNCRLLVAVPAADGYRVVRSFARIVRLGAGLDRTGRLSDAAMDRAIAALAVCAERIAESGARQVRCVATEACRRATNGADFLARVRAETGLELEVISPAEEARLASLGCHPLLDAEKSDALIFDIGGGSTEIMRLRLDGDGTPRLVDSQSLPLGVVTVAERCGPTADLDVYRAVAADIRDLLTPFEARNGLADRVAAGAVQMLGTSGTVTTLAALHQGLVRYDRARVDASWLSRDDIYAASYHLAEMGMDGRAAHPCIGRQRADLVLAGCAILGGILRAWPVDRLRVADRGVRDGILRGLMADAHAG